MKRVAAVCVLAVLVGATLASEEHDSSASSYSSSLSWSSGTPSTTGSTTGASTGSMTGSTTGSTTGAPPPPPSPPSPPPEPECECVHTWNQHVCLTLESGHRVTKCIPDHYLWDFLHAYNATLGACPGQCPDEPGVCNHCDSMMTGKYAWCHRPHGNPENAQSLCLPEVAFTEIPEGHPASHDCLHVPHRGDGETYNSTSGLGSCTIGPCEEHCTDVPTVIPWPVCQHRPEKYPGYCIAYFTYKTVNLTENDWVSMQAHTSGNRWMDAHGTGLPYRFWHHEHHSHVEPWSSFDHWYDGFQHAWDGHEHPMDIAWGGYGHDDDDWDDGWDSDDEDYHYGHSGELDWGDMHFNGTKPHHDVHHYVFVWKCAKNRRDWSRPRTRSWWVHSGYGKYGAHGWDSSWAPRWNHLEFKWNRNDCPVGCDGIPWSNKTKDACGVCGGNATTPEECEPVCDLECGPCEECVPAHTDAWGKWHDAKCVFTCFPANACEEGVCVEDQCVSVVHDLCNDHNNCTIDECVLDPWKPYGFRCERPTRVCPAAPCQTSVCENDACQPPVDIPCEPAHKCETAACSPAGGCQKFPKNCTTDNKCKVPLGCWESVGCEYDDVVCPVLPCKRLLGCDVALGCQYVDIITDFTDPCLDVSCTEQDGLVIKPVLCLSNDTCKTGQCVDGGCKFWDVPNCCDETEDCILPDDNNCEVGVCNLETNQCETQPLPIPKCCDDDHDCQGHSYDLCVEHKCVDHNCVATDLRANCTEDDKCFIYGCHASLGFPEGCFKVPRIPEDPCTECNPETGEFDPLPCDDPNPCNNDGVCMAGKCWLNEPNATACDDGNACTNDVCEDHYGEKQCTNTEKECPDKSFCRVGVCKNAQTGDCEFEDRDCGTPPDACHHFECIDHHYGGGECKLREDKCVTEDPCAPRECHPELGCRELPNPCQPRHMCETAQCVPRDDWYWLYYHTDEPAHECIYENVTCFRGNKCETGECSLRTGDCEYEDTTCPARYNCTFGTCNHWSGDCEYEYVGCETGSLCKPAECVPFLNQCVVNPVECVPRHDCEETDCNPETGTCWRRNITDCCKSDNDCYTDGRCVDAVCDDTTNTCKDVPILDCCHSDEDCDNGNECDDHVCLPDGTCDHTPKPLPGPGDACHYYKCWPSTGDFKRINNSLCIDGDPCTHDICEDHYGDPVCSNPPIMCGPGQDACHPLKCDSRTGQCKEHVEKCDDNNPCTRDRCEDHYGDAVCFNVNRTCFEGEFCRHGECNPRTGLCEPEATCPEVDLPCVHAKCDEDADMCVSENVTCPQSENKCKVCECNPRTDQCECSDIPLPPQIGCNVPWCVPETGEIVYKTLECVDDTDACNVGTCYNGFCVNWTRHDCQDNDPCTENFCKDHYGLPVCMNETIAGCCDALYDCPERACFERICDARSHKCRYEAIPNCCETADDCHSANKCELFSCEDNMCVEQGVKKCPPPSDKCHEMKCVPKTGECIEKEKHCYTTEPCKYSKCSLEDGKCHPHDYVGTCDGKCDWGYCSPYTSKWVCEPMLDWCPAPSYGYESYVDDKCHCQEKPAHCPPHPTDKCAEPYYDTYLGKCNWKPKTPPPAKDACHYEVCYDGNWVEHKLECHGDDLENWQEAYCHPYDGCSVREKPCEDKGGCVHSYRNHESGECEYDEITCEAENLEAAAALALARVDGFGMCSVRTGYVCNPANHLCEPTNDPHECCEYDWECVSGTNATTPSCVENRCRYAEKVCVSSNPCFVSVASPVTGLCEETRTEVCEAEEGFLDRLFDSWGIAPGSALRTIIPIVFGVVLIGGVILCFTMFRPRDSGSGEIRIAAKVDERQPLTSVNVDAQPRAYGTHTDAPVTPDGVRRRVQAHMAKEDTPDVLRRNIFNKRDR